MTTINVLKFNDFRKKPVTIKAAKLTTTLWAFVYGMPEHTMKIKNKNLTASNKDGNKFLIETLEGIMTAEIGDYLIIGIKDELYSCKPDIFEQTYETARAAMVYDGDDELDFSGCGNAGED